MQDSEPHTALPILDLEPLDLQIGALSESHLILAEPSILKSLGYNTSVLPNWVITTFFVVRHTQVPLMLKKMKGMQKHPLDYKPFYDDWLTTRSQIR
jgi:hypothetical protein